MAKVLLLGLVSIATSLSPPPNLANCDVTQADVQATCNSDAECKGYFQRTDQEGSSVYFILTAGLRTFSAGVPHWTVRAVYAKTNGSTTPPIPPPPSPSPSPLPPPPPPSPSPTPAPPSDATPEYQKAFYRDPGCPVEFEITTQEE